MRHRAVRAGTMSRDIVPAGQRTIPAWQVALAINAMVIPAFLMVVDQVDAGWPEDSGSSQNAMPPPALHGPPIRKQSGAFLPVGLSIPRLGVAAKIDRIGLNLDRTVRVPSNPQRLGWYTGNPAPGEPGTGVIIGHRDTNTGPAVFFRLERLRRGDMIRIGRTDNSVALFKVWRVANFPQTRFPTHAVYGSSSSKELRLITCGGDFNFKTRRYADNVVVFATLSGVEQPVQAKPAKPAKPAEPAKPAKVVQLEGGVGTGGRQ